MDKIKSEMKLILSLIALLGLVSCNSPVQVSPYKQFQGLWKLHIIEKQDSVGDWQEFHWNKGGDSYILYDGLGHMSVQFTPANYKDKSVKAPRTPIDSLTIDELRTDLKTYSSNYVYTANCKILEEQQIIEHQRLAHTYPFDWGVTVQRRFQFLGDTLVLKPVEPQNPLRLKWIKQP